MARRPFLAGLAALVGIGAKPAAAKEEAVFPPVPKWRPSFVQPLDRIVGLLNYYADGKRDFAILRHGTCVILDSGLDDAAARIFALQVMEKIFHAHPDMNPTPMDDGNILVSYNHPAVNVVLSDIAQDHWAEVEARHLDGLATSEVLITPLGPNNFDDLGKQALLGRSYFFMDAQAPEVMRIHRHT